MNALEGYTKGATTSGINILNQQKHTQERGGFIFFKGDFFYYTRISCSQNKTWLIRISLKCRIHIRMLFVIHFLCLFAEKSEHVFNWLLCIFSSSLNFEVR